MSEEIAEKITEVITRMMGKGREITEKMRYGGYENDGRREGNKRAIKGWIKK